MLLYALQLVLVKVEVLDLCLGVPKLLKVNLPVLLHLLRVNLSFIFKAVINFSGYANSKSEILKLK